MYRSTLAVLPRSSLVVNREVLEEAQSLRGTRRSIVKTDGPPLPPPLPIERPIERLDEKHKHTEDDPERDRARGGVQRPSFHRR
jgi:hypothetical protein